jgi:rhamnogalacturonyl hydrolase YesR
MQPHRQAGFSGWAKDLSWAAFAVVTALNLLVRARSESFAFFRVRSNQTRSQLSAIVAAHDIWLDFQKTSDSYLCCPCYLMLLES